MALAAVRTQAKPSSFWRDRTEQELLDLEFTTSAPELLDGVLDAPPTTDDAIIEFGYDVQGRPEGKAKCAFCKYPNHFKGVVVKLPDGSRRLVGKDCGHKHYGVNFKLLVKDFDAARDRAGWLRRRHALLNAAPALLDGIDRLLADRTFPAFIQVRNRLRYVLQDGLTAKIAASVNRKEPLWISERVRDYAAEERRRDEAPEHTDRLRHMNHAEQRRYRRRHHLPDPEIYVTVTKAAGILQGGALFAGHADPQFRCTDIARDISNVIGSLRAGLNLSTTQLGGASGRLMTLIDRLEAEIAKLKAPAEFFEYSNLEMVVNWARHHDPIHTIRCGIGWIERGDEYDDVRRATFPPNFLPPSDDFIGVFRQSISLAK